MEESLRGWILGAFVIACASPVLARPISLIAPIGALTILPPIAHSGLQKPYGPSGPDPNWNIAQWSAPSVLGEFAATGSASWLSRSAAGSVTLSDKSGKKTVELTQSGRTLPCFEDGAPREFDLFLQPNAGNVAGAPNAMTPAGPHSISLGKMSSLRLEVSASATFSNAESEKRCAVNQASALIGIVLQDLGASPIQTLFYQLNLLNFCGRGSRMKTCHAEADAPSYFFEKNPFGADDTLLLADGRYLTAGKTATLDLDVLPRLKLVIENGPAGIDQEWSHWIISGVYLGQHIWGDVDGKSAWSNFRLTAETP